MLHRIGSAAESAFCFLAMSILLGAYTPMPMRMQGVALTGGESNPYNVVAMAFVLAGTLVLVALNWRGVLTVAWHSGLVNLFMILAAVSVVWSYEPGTTARRALVLGQTFFFAYYLVSRFPVERVIRKVAFVLAVAMLASVVVAVTMPSVGIMQVSDGVDVAGAWAGVFAHKSPLGACASFGAICFGWLWMWEPRRRVLHTFGILLCLFIVLVASSRTAQVSILLLTGIAFCLPLLRLPGLARLWVIFMLVLASTAGSALFSVFFVDIMEALGKDPTLTGRVPIWHTLWDMAWQRPMTGYGYSAFFVAENPDVEQVWRDAGWQMWTAHNMFVEMFVQLGIPGVTTAALVLVTGIGRALRAYAAGAASWASFAVLFVFSYAITNVLEASMFRYGDLHMAVFVVLYVSLHFAIKYRPTVTRPAPMAPPRMRPAYGPRT